MLNESSRNQQLKTKYGKWHHRKGELDRTVHSEDIHCTWCLHIRTSSYSINQRLRKRDPPNRGNGTNYNGKYTPTSLEEKEDHPKDLKDSLCE
ncbi:hypothetical protein T07_2974 [Trichinella nelsoni]|uniref:Uncharacterized protein n=1 Tax=Trichinella nelsoni TaxID=6336 RepID=A0A0V0RYI5_9BILA|nr:hypothetical protein T07_2974 [Trichinella nelsoni]